MQKVAYLCVLVLGVYMDCRSRELDIRYLIISAMVGGIFAAKFLVTGGRWLDLFLSCNAGVLLLLISYLTRGAIGEGDGWFFVISGLFLTWKENFILLCAGWFLCFLYCLLDVGWSIGKRSSWRGKSVPFLPFLLPAGICLTVLAG